MVYIFIIAFSVYGPLDFIGAYTKADTVLSVIADGDRLDVNGNIIRKEIKKDSTIYYVKDATINCEKGTLTNISIIRFIVMR